MSGREMKGERAAMSAGPSDVSTIRAANAHLEMSIRAMRDRLEHQKAEADAAIRKTQAGLAGEISALRATMIPTRLPSPVLFSPYTFANPKSEIAP